MIRLRFLLLFGCDCWLVVHRQRAAIRSTDLTIRVNCLLVVPAIGMASRSCFYVVCSGSVETCEVWIVSRVIRFISLLPGADLIHFDVSECRLRAAIICFASSHTTPERIGVSSTYVCAGLKLCMDWCLILVWWWWWWCDESQGTESGLSQIAKRSNNSVTWNYPLEVTFKSTNVHGWPQLVILVCGYNFWNQQVVRGYGCVHIPPTPGRHVRHIPLYTPLSSSWFMQCINWLTGNHAEFMEHNFVARSRGREVTRVRSNGHVKVVLNVMTKNMNDFGYSVDSERWQDASDGSTQAIKLLARAPLTAPPKPQDFKDHKHARDEPTKPQRYVSPSLAPGIIRSGADMRVCCVVRWRILRMRLPHRL